MVFEFPCKVATVAAEKNGYNAYVAKDETGKKVAFYSNMMFSYGEKIKLVFINENQAELPYEVTIVSDEKLVFEKSCGSIIFENPAEQLKQKFSVVRNHFNVEVVRE